MRAQRYELYALSRIFLRKRIFFNKIFVLLSIQFTRFLHNGKVLTRKAVVGHAKNLFSSENLIV